MVLRWCRKGNSDARHDASSMNLIQRFRFITETDSFPYALGSDQSVQYAVHLSFHSISSRLEEYPDHRRYRGRWNQKWGCLLRCALRKSSDLLSKWKIDCSSAIEFLLRLFDPRHGVIRWHDRYSDQSAEWNQRDVSRSSFASAVRGLWPREDFPRVCGTYEQLEYWPNGFDDFYVSQREFRLRPTAMMFFSHRSSLFTTSWLSINGSYSSMAFVQPRTPGQHLSINCLCLFSSRVFRWSELYFIFWYLFVTTIGLNICLALSGDVSDDAFHRSMLRSSSIV